MKEYNLDFFKNCQLQFTLALSGKRRFMNQQVKHLLNDKETKLQMNIINKCFPSKNKFNIV